MHPKWLLPEFVDDVLPREAKRVELIRRQILDLFVVGKINKLALRETFKGYAFPNAQAAE